MELGKATLKLVIISWAIYSTLGDQWQVLLSLASLSLRDGLSVLVEIIFSMGFRVGQTYLVFCHRRLPLSTPSLNERSQDDQARSETRDEAK